MFNIFRNAVIRNATHCRHDNSDGYAVVWGEDDDFKQYGEYGGLTTRLVWDRNYFAVATSGTCYIGPTTDQVPFDGGVYDRVKATFRVEVGFGLTPPTTGRIQFQTSDDPVYDSTKVVDFTINPDNAYNEYTIDMSQTTDWQGEILRMRLYPFIDGDPGTIIHLQSLRAQSSRIFSCDTRFNTPLCDKLSQYSHPCPWVGTGGSCEADTVADGIDIEEGVNDRLVVNVNGYGDQAVTITPVRAARLQDIARDVEEKLSNIGIGGYAGNKVEVSFGKMEVTADDTREAVSTVVVKDSPAARTLGFFDSSGNDLSVCLAGEDAASRYESAGTVRLSRGQLAHFYLPDPGVNRTAVVLDPRQYAVQAGRSDYTKVYKQQKIDFTNKTIIEFNNPFTNNGVVTYLAYAGNATTDTKFVFLRPKADGSLTQYATVGLGATSTRIDKVFGRLTSVRVRKGDLIGIFDGQLDMGRTEQYPNASYFLYDGETENDDVLPAMGITGRGEQGLRLFARGIDKETDVVLDLEFEQPELIEEVTVVAEEEGRVEEVNLTRGRAGGINGGPFVEGWTGVDKYGAQAPALTNLGAVTDGVKHTDVDADTLYPSWLDTAIEPADKYDQTEFSVVLDFAKGAPVFFDISRVVLYFRDVANIKFFALEYPITTNDADTDRNWGLVAGTYSAVSLEGKPLEPDDHPLYTNPMQPTIGEHEHSYQLLEYRVLDVSFDSVRARSLRYNVKNYAFEDDTTKITWSDFALAPSPHILEFEVFAESTPTASIADNFFFESSTDGENYVVHPTVRADGATSARYLIGYPVQYLRVNIRPQGKIWVKSLSASLSRSQTQITTNAGDQFVGMNVSKEDFTSYETITVTNDGEETFNYFVGIAGQKNPVERCILWNKMGSAEEIATSEIGPSPSTTKRDDFFPREYNYALNVPAYVVDPFWLLNRNALCYISYDHGATWNARGNTAGDYSTGTSLTAVNPDFADYLFTYALVDLGDVYDLDTIQSVSGGTAWSSPLYSNKDVSDPDELNLADDFDGVKEQARWLRYRTFSRAADDVVNPIAVLYYVRASLDVLSATNKDKIPWVPVTKLTNYVFGGSLANSCGEGWQCNQSGFNNYYAVYLEDEYRITNMLLGPQFTSGLATKSNIATSVPGGAGSAYSSSTNRSNSNITYSNSPVTDPNRVAWGDFGDEPGERSRWVLLRRQGSHLDEVAVSIENNIGEDKPSFGSERWWTAQLGTVRKDRSNYQEGLFSMAIDYDVDAGPAVEEIELVRYLGVDYILAKRDQLRLLLYVSDVSQLDFSLGHIAIGRNTEEGNGGWDVLEGITPDRINYFQWDLLEMEGQLRSGWNELLLPFSDNFRVGQPYFTSDDFFSLSATSTSGRSQFRWFRVNFAGKADNSAFTINIDGMKIVRSEFLPAKFGSGLYLAGEEYAKFPLTNFDPMRGTIEFYLNPDWTKIPGCNSCEDPRDHTIFRFFNSDGYVLGAFMTGEGLRVYLSDGVHHYFLTDDRNLQFISAGVNVHLAVTWDILGQDSNKALAVYIDNKLSSSFAVENITSSDFHPNPNTVFLLGGLGWEGVIIPMADSVGGVVDNVRVYNYPINDFSHSVANEGLAHIRPSDELIEVSIDGGVFYGSELRGHGLPLLVRNVAPGESFNVYVRNKDNEGVSALEGQERNSYVEIIKARAG